MRDSVSSKRAWAGSLTVPPAQARMPFSHRNFPTGCLGFSPRMLVSLGLMVVQGWPEHPVLWPPWGVLRHPDDRGKGLLPRRRAQGWGWSHTGCLQLPAWVVLTWM